MPASTCSEQQSLLPGPTRRAWLAGSAAGAWLALGTAGRVAADEKITLTVAAFPLVDEIARAALPAWQRLHPNVAVEVLTRQYADHHTAMSTALSTAALLPDVLALESSKLGRFAQGGGLENLAQAPFALDRYRPLLVPYAYDQAIARNGAVVAVPTDIGPGTLLYRQDILALAAVDAAELTRSWDGYIAAGARIKKQTGAFFVAHVQQIKDILIRTGIAPGEGIYFDQNSRVLVQSERFVRAFELALKVRRLGLDARITAWSNEWAEGFKRGTLATELSGAWLVGQLSNWIAPQTAGLWRAADLPEGANAGYGGAFYAIPRKLDATRKLLAWQFIQLMTLDRERQLTAFKTHDAFPALLAAHEDPFFDAPVAFLGGQPARQLWRQAARRISAVPVHKQDPFADEVIGSELDHVLNRGKSIRTALADAQALLERRAHR
ncbi:extracellular solute-binding protein [Paucibacter sp. TC2R-5]|uniref:ABC transporter substrate-binding protein n=1 Tax=Paucibacter sp. TC2R-5 TaxID=2893555 RepID=UPI0021E38652|nr:extracellular solute-binding protein [Paucibacter sp. TC2R-5]MCV2358663.1 extracellular solute-binding protein [Paucibacter sp. TC2R-5]